uniref:Ubiquinone biosynthesis protein COQ9-B-like n=1 Tax=Rhizophora mucronata TaxID=61149 RepID=A0A2P2KVR5_RHIMU
MDEVPLESAPIRTAKVSIANAILHLKPSAKPDLDVHTTILATSPHSTCNPRKILGIYFLIRKIEKA